MARYALAMLLFVGAAVVGVKSYAAESTKADEQAIAKIESEWTDATKNKTKAFFEKYLAEDVTYISEEGVFSAGRAAYIDMVMKLPKVADAKASDEKVAVHQTTGVATGRFTIKYDNGESSSTLYTDVYAKGPDGWKVVASQETKAK
jgi:ketosteroid isomerase-like protein